ncbi:peroxiredoxin [Bdellovibrio bacteriovorus]|uniref:thioredoxin-dependent peroxiredoxin n=1 Tax=Bdellovibrio bacteriovorus TaxID=959 RepID=A0A150WKN2_BDEBC|nr:peroxiredoxin [Bdellovibrio bacteriovorus]KYG64091.1 peroxiredoxin [Bdellovibrio bacteriovorus]
MAAKLEIGKKVPNFKVPSSNGEDFELSSLKGQKVVLYFYPKDNTPGCTIQSNEFNGLLSQFKKQNAVVLGVSRDSLKSHDKFIDKFKFKFDLLSDEDEVVCKIFDVIKEKNMYGKKVLGIERSAFVIDENQKLVGEFRKVKAEGNAQEVLNFIKKL